MAEEKVSGIRVFVYGSLKHGFGNHPLLEDSQCINDGAELNGKYAMVSYGAFPAVYTDGGLPDGKITGEVYVVDQDTLDSLDILEGHPSFYERSKRKIDGQNVWVYLLPKDEAEMLPAVESGTWEKPTW